MRKLKIINVLIIILFITACTQKNKTEIVSNLEHPEWSYNQTIYEANVRQFTEEGTFVAFQEHLPRLKEMGIGIIWLMPIHPIGELNRKGGLGSYYSVKDYKGINPNFGTKQDFRNLVNEIHKLGMHVVIDWVANHTSWDNPWTKTNKDYFTLDSLGNFVPPVADWSDVIDLNYDNKNMRNEMIDALKYWVKEFNIDGYRCDVAAMVPNDFWSDARKELDKIKPVFMLAEAHEPEFHKNGFDMTYGWQLKDLMNNYAIDSVGIEEIKNHFLVDEDQYEENDFRMVFTTNHDENSWNGTIQERLGKFAEPFSVLISTAEGMPLVYSGQEAGLNKALKFFEKDLVDWQDHKQSEIFSKLFDLKKTNKALWNGNKGGKMNFIKVSENEKVLAYSREMEEDKIIVVLNLSPKKSKIKFNDEKIFGGYCNVFSNANVTIDNKIEFDLNPYEYLVFSN